MKLQRMVFLLLFSLSILTAKAQETVKITFKYKFINVNEGFDHVSRMRVYLDGVLLGTSNPDGTLSEVSNTHKETAENIFAIEIPKGVHAIRAVVEAYYEKVWEEHLIANGYALDCVYEKTLDFKKDNAIELQFDIETEKTIIIKE